MFLRTLTVAVALCAFAAPVAMAGDGCMGTMRSAFEDNTVVPPGDIPVPVVSEILTDAARTLALRTDQVASWSELVDAVVFHRSLAEAATYAAMGIEQPPEPYTTAMVSRSFAALYDRLDDTQRDTLDNLVTRGLPLI